MPMTIETSSHASSSVALRSAVSSGRPSAHRSSTRTDSRRLLVRVAGALVFLVATVGGARASLAQQPVARVDSAPRSSARAQLQREADSLSAAGKAAEAAAVRQRLTEGDFRPGDRILLTVTGNFAFSDTLAVREGQVVTIGSLPDIPLRGVLRAELNDYMTQQLSRFVREPVVRAQALTRLAVLGAVGRPGFYALPADILLGDAIMHAGGPTPTADLSRTIVKRGKSEVLSRQQVQRAISEGKTLDRMDLRAGDEIVVAEKKQRNVMNMVYATTALLGLALTLYSLATR
jgi:protein involved in polysaccharide export with SLBB domain